MITDKQEAIEKVKQDGRSLCYASEELRNDRDVVLAAVKQDGLSIVYASQRLQREFKDTQL